MQEESYWIEKANHVPVFSSVLPASADTVVVGGGIAGLSTAYHLLQAGRSVVVLERAGVGQGATGHSTGMLTGEVGSDYVELYRRRGLGFVRRVFDALTYGGDLLRDTVLKEKIDCDWQSVRALAFGTTIESVRSARDEFEMLRTLHVPVEWLNGEKVTDRFAFLRLRAGLLSAGHAVVDPYQLALGLARSVVANGGTLVEEVAYEGYHCEGDVMVVRTSQGTLTARCLFLCSDNDAGAWLSGRVPLVSVTETVAVTEPVDIVPGWTQGELLWNEFPLFEYARRLPDRRIMFGSGRSSKLSHTSHVPMDRSLMRRVFEETFTIPYPRIDYLWRGSFGVTDDELPYAGEVEPGVYLAGGYNGHGLILGFLSGELLARMATGQPHPYVDLFGIPHTDGRFGKWLYRYTPSCVRHMATQAYLDHLHARDIRARRRP
ncbi:TPA: hypothetical protein DDZ10_02770 [Candidatus Uhrbacteria bacterium]|uniref:FAD dependent oxidoreductase domain-containing protein n=1 Tax=Candidatus Uhrbacteria bacterium GW2011_GWC2_53_7 TaxID=1618986 RepID=A0A0G2AU73_9BACT|nr:MAG: hypothetical protein UY82_C0025G0005 [Candidatus Uhrbacteria bacterium GW2011_GWC2_53_7]OGL72845.1 MAG: hypothetical protein A3D69_01055 [Candidatus Uhrbacteria bacterium RIFCSPHIGHO2_02_FULL_54_11]HBL39572.1 hypothetical protein [Candidatus Uhrbacteria bacterium]